jgi:hypothetical protein
VIRGRPPWSVEQFNSVQFFQRNAAPVGWRSRRFEAALTLASVLITEHPKLTLLVPPQPVWTEQTRIVVIKGRNGPPVLNRLIHGPVNRPKLPRSACARTRHSSTLRSASLTLIIPTQFQTFYDTVVLVQKEF